MGDRDQQLSMTKINPSVLKSVLVTFHGIKYVCIYIFSNRIRVGLDKMPVFMENNACLYVDYG